VQAVLNNEPFRCGGDDTLTDVPLFEDIFRIWMKQNRP
jgi:hypothetical protein